MAQPFLSIVVPAFNEEARIVSTLEELSSFIATCPYESEVVVADDGSQDATASMVMEFSQRDPRIKLIKLDHRGKGWAVKKGMLAAAGQYRLLCDADLAVPIQMVERLLPPRCEGADVAVGSREAPGARRIGEPSGRHAMGRIFNTLVRWLAVPRLKDTQCGFKCFKGKVADQLFQDQTMDGFAFDVEVLFLAHRRGLRLCEVPVDWFYRERSKVRPIRDSLAMTRDLLKIRWNYRWGKQRANPR